MLYCNLFVTYIKTSTFRILSSFGMIIIANTQFISTLRFNIGNIVVTELPPEAPAEAEASTSRVSRSFGKITILLFFMLDEGK